MRCTTESKHSCIYILRVLISWTDIRQLTLVCKSSRAGGKLSGILVHVSSGAEANLVSQLTCLYESGRDTMFPWLLCLHAFAKMKRVTEMCYLGEVFALEMMCFRQQQYEKIYTMQHDFFLILLNLCAPQKPAPQTSSYSA